MDLHEHATRVDWKQVLLSDFVFSQKLQLLRVSVHPQSYLDSTHSQPFELWRGCKAEFRFTSAAKP